MKTLGSAHAFVDAAIAGLHRYPCLKNFLGNKVKNWYAKAEKLGPGKLYTGRLDLPSMLATVHWIEKSKASPFEALIEERTRKATAVVQAYLSRRSRPQDSEEIARCFVAAGLTDAKSIRAAYKADIKHLYEMYDSILTQINDAISVLGVNKCQNSFQNKFSSVHPESGNFLSSVSELCVAVEFQRAGYDVEFEVEYVKARPDGSEVMEKGEKKPDFDIQARCGTDGLFMEVYNPLDGLTAGSPLADEKEVVKRIRRKAVKQFGPEGSHLIDPATGQSLPGHAFLAINLSYEAKAYFLDTAPQIEGSFPLNIRLLRNLTDALSKISALEGFLIFELPYPTEEKVLKMVNGKLYLLPSFKGHQPWVSSAEERFTKSRIDLRIIDFRKGY